ncbi:MAG: dihydroorotate dehydrogenase [Actinomycetota bacterium]|nr:dihydroorotate dehydrogenase [Actinomycetota bacterium]
MRTRVGTVALSNPVLTASGTAGRAAELGAYVELADLGAVVVKSLSAEPWPGNPAPRVHPTPAGMINSVGLQGPGIQSWLADDLPALVERGATVVASIWGRSVDEFARAAGMLAGARGVVAVEVNVSCPNVEDRSRMFAHSPEATAAAVDAAGRAGLPRWVKLSPNVPDLVGIAGAAIGAGAEALVLVNTVLGMAIDPRRRAYRLGSGAAGGGLSGPAIRPIAVRAVHDCRAAFPTIGIVGVGGIARGVDAAEMLVAGADAVEVGTATFADPRAPAVVLRQLHRWCARHRVRSVRDLVGSVHEGQPVVPLAAEHGVGAGVPGAGGVEPGAVGAGVPGAGGVEPGPIRDGRGAGASPPEAAPVARIDEPDAQAEDTVLLARVRATLDAIDQRVALQAEQVGHLADAMAALAAALGSERTGGDTGGGAGRDRRGAADGPGQAVERPI